MKRVRLIGGSYSTTEIYLAGSCRKAVYDLPQTASVNDCRRADNCHQMWSLEEGVISDFACRLGTYGCTEGHGDYEISGAEQLHRAIRRYPFPSLRFALAQRRLAHRERGWK